MLNAFVLSKVNNPAMDSMINETRFKLFKNLLLGGYIGELGFLVCSGFILTV